jgi:hypothetical protein
MVAEQLHAASQPQVQALRPCVQRTLQSSTGRWEQRRLSENCLRLRSPKNAARAGLLGTEDPLRAYPWSSFPFHLSHTKHRPGWIRSERLFGAHGIQADTPAGRAEFEQRLESRRRAEELDAEEWKPLRRGWCLGSEQFKEQMLELIGDKLGEHHSGELKRETAELKAERIIAEELTKLKWTNADLKLRLKSDPQKSESRIFCVKKQLSPSGGLLSD